MKEVKTRKPKFNIFDKVKLEEIKEPLIITGLYFDEKYESFVYSFNDLSDLLEVAITKYEEPKWIFTEDEKVILRNLPKKYKYIARDYSSNLLWIYESKPRCITPTHFWKPANDSSDFDDLHLYTKLFKTIKSSDDEPCLFREYV